MHPSLILRNSAGSAALKQGAKRDPELYVLAAVMSGIFGVAGYYFGSKPTSATSEDTAIKVANMPWQGSSQSGKYQYHPDGNPANAPKDAPSALHSVIVPNVSLPKELHERFNKYGKDGY
ncbi:hypothetical protein BZA05DRAFT_185887 [Tricharina praecox]|uniref:uncharacterized protein n=1 Tax=Tricharina praecox TaxID=43433 RepID=UPI00221FF7B4|nr:uncharacterized protein BZA05DRAFT_185887 [Tricharina praecox]KAI5843280.1 hypothetical protein BZA05DRAFT_185887 [Tricharina praecox]